MKLISIVIPFFNEADNLLQIYGEVQALRKNEPSYSFEIIFMDNQSTDESFAVAVGLARQDSTVRVIRLSRNFGYQVNILTGYLNARGDAAVQLDADGEDDPALVSEFLRKWEDGHEIIYGIRMHREDSKILQIMRKLFYRVIGKLSNVPIPIDAGDFRLIDRKVLDALPRFKESSLYIRGLFSYIGFRQTGIPYSRRRRYRGQSKFRLWDYFSLAIDGITSFSTKPLFVVAQLGLALSCLSLLAIIFYLGLYLRGHVVVRGFTTLVILQFLLSGIQLICLGLNGMYIGRIFDEVKSRPRSLIETTYPPSDKAIHA